jgi:uncharacterized membrane protein YhhN
MTRQRLTALLAGVILSGSLAIAGIELNRPALTVAFKPLATILLLFVVGLPTYDYARFVVAGILFSLVGDIALLKEDTLSFEIGLGAFLLAHVAYIVGSVRVGVRSTRVLAVGVIAVATTAFLLTKLWHGAAGLRGPVLLYGAALTGMLIGASSTLGGRLAWPKVLFAGSILFYISDASLALNRFHRPIPHVAFLSLGVYWLGQIGIALAARGGLREPLADRALSEAPC